MPSHMRAFRSFARPVHLLVGAAATALFSVAFTPAALAQGAAGCGDVQKFLLERKAIVERLQSVGKKKMDPKFACAAFGQLVTNGTGLMKWMNTNKDWCQVPETFANGIKADHERASTMRGKACQVAAQQVQMEKRARQQAGQGGQGQGNTLLGGGGLEGSYKMPQGAL